jgi:hypothetical protein
MSDSEEPDYDINEIIQERIGRGISEGHWLEFIRICVRKRKDKMKISLLVEGYRALEENNKVKIVDDDLEIKTDRVGLLSGWIRIRNAIIHGRELTEKEKNLRLPQLLDLIKTVIYFIEPLSKYHYCQRLKGKTFTGVFDLTGVENFAEINQVGDVKSEAFLVVDKEAKKHLPLYPLYIARKSKKAVLKESLVVAWRGLL